MPHKQAKVTKEDSSETIELIRKNLGGTLIWADNEEANDKEEENGGNQKRKASHKQLSGQHDVPLKSQEVGGCHTVGSSVQGADGWGLR